MSDLDKTAKRFFDHAPMPMGIPQVSGWQALAAAIGLSPQASASQDIPNNNPPKASNGETDPYKNFANKATGLPYK